MQPGQPQQPYGQPPSTPQPVGGGNNTQLGAILMLVCGACIIVGLVSKSFVSASWDEGSESINVGFMSAQVCDGGDCESLDFDKMKSMGDVKIVRMLGLIAGFIAAGLCGLAGLMAFSNKQPPTKAMQGVFGLTSFCFAFFLFRFISEGKGEVSFGPGFAAFIGFGGLIGASIISKTMFKHLLPAGAAVPSGYGAQPVQQGYPPPPPPPPAATTACTRCGQPAQFVAQYQRWYCPSCQQYL